MIKRKAYAKVNLCLDVLRRREDGYHDVRMIMQTVDLYDELTFDAVAGTVLLARDGAADAGTDDTDNITLKILNIPQNVDIGPVENNLIYRAAKLVFEEYDIKETGVIITLDKHIPVAAGMAGGSTDAACVFHGLNALLNLNMSVEDMCRLGVKLGADIPYCITGGTCLSEGIGEKLTALPTPPECTVLIVKPDINVSTAFVYKNLHIETVTNHPDVDGMIEDINKQDLTSLAAHMGNVLENVTVSEYPVIDSIKTKINESGALNALMSGSGPTVFGIYDKKDIMKAQECAAYFKENYPSYEVFVTTFH